MKSAKMVFISFSAILVLLTACSAAGDQSTAKAELFMMGENGEQVLIEPVETEEALTERALEVMGRLEEEPYIESALLTVSPSPEDEALLCFQANLRGSQLDTHVDEILSVVTQGTDAWDTGNSSLLDASTGQFLPLS